MVEQNEVVTLILAIGVIILSAFNLGGLRNAVNSRLLPAAFITVCAAWVFTVIEGIACSTLFNYLEHICYLASAMLLAMWVWKLKRHATAAKP